MERGLNPRHRHRPPALGATGATADQELSVLPAETRTVTEPVLVVSRNGEASPDQAQSRR